MILWWSNANVVLGAPGASSGLEDYSQSSVLLHVGKMTTGGNVTYASYGIQYMWFTVAN